MSAPPLFLVMGVESFDIVTWPWSAGAVAYGVGGEGKRTLSGREAQ